MFNYPLNLAFKVISWGPQVSVTDASGQEVLFVHMKALKLKEAINVYTDSSRNQQLFNMQADRVIDFSARYNFAEAGGMGLGSIKREGMRSLWKASYNVFDAGEQITHHIKEDDPMVRFIDSLIANIPFVGMISGYIFHPSFTLYQSGSEMPVFQMTKQPAFFEGKFELVKKGEPANDQEESRLVLGMIMMVLLERMRG